MILPRGNEIVQPEIWAPISKEVIPNIEDIYTISTYGRTFNSKTSTYLPQNMFYYKDKYITISLRLEDGSHVFAQPHRLVLMTFAPCDGMEVLEVNHKDGIKYHNWLWNLEWATHKENLEHASKTELFTRKGDSRNNTIITEKEVHQMCKLISEGYSRSQIVKMMNLENGNCVSLYGNIMSGHCWNHISKQYDFSNAYRRAVFSDEEKETIVGIIKRNPGYTNTEVLKEMGIDKSDPRIANYRSAVNFIRKKI